jgi:hypothetical protein
MASGWLSLMPASEPPSRFPKDCVPIARVSKPLGIICTVGHAGVIVIQVVGGTLILIEAAKKIDEAYEHWVKSSAPERKR